MIIKDPFSDVHEFNKLPLISSQDPSNSGRFFI